MTNPLSAAYICKIYRNMEIGIDSFASTGELENPHDAVNRVDFPNDLHVLAR